MRGTNDSKGGNQKAIGAEFKTAPEVYKVYDVLGSKGRLLYSFSITDKKGKLI